MTAAVMTTIRLLRRRTCTEVVAEAAAELSGDESAFSGTSRRRGGGYLRTADCGVNRGLRVNCE